ncbi:MAG: hypothetical protein HY673_21205 [Chloroflexi bacterium]|nr:hypothetical protein [Chloroflexota bacterium]
MKKVTRMLALGVLLFALAHMAVGPSLSRAAPAPGLLREMGVQYQGQPGRSGKLSPSLEKLLREKRDQDVVTVGLWMRADDLAVEREVTRRYPNARLQGARPSKDTPPAVWKQVDKELRETPGGQDS